MCISEQDFFKRTVTASLRALRCRRPIEANSTSVCIDEPLPFGRIDVFYIDEKWGFAFGSPTGITSVCLVVALDDLYHCEDYFEACDEARQSPQRPSKLN